MPGCIFSRLFKVLDDTFKIKSRASGSYGLSAAVTDHRIKAIATVSPADVGQFRNGSDGYQNPDFIQGILDLAAVDRNNTAQGQETGAFPIFPATAEQGKHWANMALKDGNITVPTGGSTNAQ